MYNDFLQRSHFMKQTQRIFIPGSEWFYLKIYSGEKTLDKILVQELYRIINKALKKVGYKNGFSSGMQIRSHIYEYVFSLRIQIIYLNYNNSFTRN